MALLVARAGTTDGIACAGVVHLGDKNVEIYGEIHGTPNAFCQRLVEGGLLDEYEVLCEATPAWCEGVRKRPHDGHHHPPTGLLYLVANLPREPACVDIRAVHGLPSGLEERSFQQFFAEMSSSVWTADSLRSLEQLITRMRQTRSALHPHHKRLGIELGWTYERMDRAIERELRLLGAMIRRGVGFIEQHPAVLCRVGMALTRNVQKVCGALVDVHIKSLVEQSTSPRIAVFTGAAHAFRLVDVLFAETGRLVVEPSDEWAIDVMWLSSGDDEWEQTWMRRLGECDGYDRTPTTV